MDKKKLSRKKRNELLVILQNVSNLRTGQDQVIWSIFGAFWGTNALLLISLFSVGEEWNIRNVATIISIIGIFISLVWTLIQIRAINRIKMYEDSMSYIENKLDLSIEIRTYSKPPLESFCVKVKARTVMILCCFVAMVAWIGSFIFFLWLFK
jgi:hypothetical protein